MDMNVKELHSKISGCFGCVDYKFSCNPNDQERAKELRRFLKTMVYDQDDIELLFYGYLAKNKCQPDHIEDQMKEVRKYFGWK